MQTFDPTPFVNLTVILMVVAVIALVVSIPYVYRRLINKDGQDKNLKGFLLNDPATRELLMKKKKAAAPGQPAPAAPAPSAAPAARSAARPTAPKAAAPAARPTPAKATAPAAKPTAPPVTPPVAASPKTQPRMTPTSAEDAFVDLGDLPPKK